MENQLQTTTQAEVLTPAEMIMQGVKAGTDLKLLKEALELQITWEKRQAEKAYNHAIAAFKANPPEIIKESAVNFNSGGKQVGYKYASLANVIEKVTPELSKHGLTLSWRTAQNGKISVTCRISHELGHHEETTLCADADTSGAKNSIQAIGSTITYMQRYTALALLGLACADQDDDGRASSPTTAPSAAVERINEKQLSSILDLLAAKNQKESTLLKLLRLDKLENLPASNYQKTVDMLNKAPVAKGTK